MTPLAHLSNRRHPPQHVAAAIEWEETPSLAHLVSSGGARAPSWDDTRPATFEDLCETPTVHEPLPGLAVLESCEPEIFRLFFGTDGLR